MGDRGEGAGAADLDLDPLQQRLGLLGGELVRDRPARRAADHAEALLPVEAVDLVDDAVDLVVQSGARLADLPVKGQRRVGRGTAPYQRIDREAPALQPLQEDRKSTRLNSSH